MLKIPSGPLQNGPSAGGGAGRGAAPGRGGPGGNVEASVVRSVRSPEVSADHKITFRFAALNAKQVQVQGDFTIHQNTVLEMTSDGNGVWSFTTDALKPSTYQYWFIVDGQQTPDPVNTYVRPASGVYKSMVDVPGPGMEFMAFRDVPHGVVSEHTYLNRDNGTRRQVEVYTPPGYGKSNQSYPVLYLLHGANDYERGWTQSGRANLIMDNLIADGKAVPCIIVMPFGHDYTGSMGKQPEIAAIQQSLGMTPRANGGSVPSASLGGAPGGGGGFGGGAPGGRGPGRGAGGPGGGAATGAPGTAPATGPVAGAGRGGPRGPGGGRGGFGGPGGGNYMERDLLNNVIPLVESEYRVLKDANHRAIAGYSMGAGQSSSIGLSHPELFAYVCAYSGGSQTGAIGPALADVAKTNAHYKLIWIGCGDDDTTALNGARSFDQLLTQRGVTHTYVESPGYHHDYQIWRIYLGANLQMLFRD